MIVAVITLTMEEAARLSPIGRRRAEEEAMRDDIARDPKPSPPPEKVNPAPGAPEHTPEEGIARIEHREVGAGTTEKSAKEADPKLAE